MQNRYVRTVYNYFNKHRYTDVSIETIATRNSKSLLSFIAIHSNFHIITGFNYIDQLLRIY